MRSASDQYSIAGILVRARPDDLAALTTRLAALPGVDVHHQDQASGRVVVTLEAAGTDTQQQGLDAIRREPGVISAELVYHYVAPPDRLRTPPGPQGDS